MYVQTYVRTYVSVISYIHNYMHLYAIYHVSYLYVCIDMYSIFDDMLQFFSGHVLRRAPLLDSRRPCLQPLIICIQKRKRINSRLAWTPACECSRAPAMDTPLREAAMSRASCDQRGHESASNSKLKHR